MNGLAPLGKPCLGKVFFVWALYGWATLMLWRMVHGDPWGNAITWVVALVAALGLLLGMREV